MSELGINELEELRAALRSLPSADWATRALTALADPALRYSGNRESGSTAATDLRRIYEIRLARQKERGTVASGMEELVSELRVADDAERIRIVPFLSESYVVGAFYSPAGRLIGCISGPHDKPEESRIREG
ncbi:MAG TPA: hypothetical protein VGN07_22510 [Steroidobacteraceae bacterium]|jgi:glycine/D-amino acid oxidase-like deaminating enzyme